MMIVCSICGLTIGFCIGVVLTYKYVANSMQNQVKKAEKIADKHLAIMNLFSVWIQNRDNNLAISSYLLNKNIRSVAIYGMSFVGERLYDELERSEITVGYCIDKNANNIYKDTLVVTPDSLPENIEIDAVIVSAFTFYDEIKNELEKKMDVPILSIDDIVYCL